MEKNPNEQNSDIGQTGQAAPQSDAGQTGQSSHSHHSSGSGSHGGSHSHSSSGSSHSGSHSHSGSSHSGSHSRSGSSSSSGESKKSKKSSVSLYKRVRHQLKYYYWKYQRRFKKANKVKKAGYIVLVLSFVLLLAIAMKYALLSGNSPDLTTDPIVTAAPTTVVITTEKPVPIAPNVVTYYQINDTYKVDEVFSSGFIVSLPNIVSNKPLAQNINAQMDKIRDAVKAKYNSVANIKTFREQYNYSYASFVKDNILFLSVFTAHGARASEFVTSNKYYAYDFENDKIASNAVILQMYNINAAEILDTVNAELLAVGAAQINTTDNIQYFVKSDGKLWADVKVKALLDGTAYSELVQLT